MSVIIRSMRESDRCEICEMMRVFYGSDAVSTNGSPEIFAADFDECISNSPYLSGYVFEYDGDVAGYAMTAHSFSTEFGRRCVWIEDLYVKENYRRYGMGRAFFDFIEEKHRDEIFRLEVEEFNTGALSLYKKRGFSTLPYLEMIKFGG